MNEPRPVTVTRWRCTTTNCHKSFATRTRARAHAAECPRDPDNRSCLTCAHFTDREDGGWDEPGHPAACDLDLPVGGLGTGEPMPRDCPTWAPQRQ